MNTTFMSCHICNKTFITKKGLNHHIGKHKDDIQFDCSICKTKFISIYSLKRHIASHDTKKFNCNICDRSFATNSRLVEHKKTHNQVKSFPCYCCGKIFLFQYDIKRHLEKKIPCKWNFNSTAGLSQQYLDDFESEILLDMRTYASAVDKK